MFACVPAKFARTAGYKSCGLRAVRAGRISCQEGKCALAEGKGHGEVCTYIRTCAHSRVSRRVQKGIAGYVLTCANSGVRTCVPSRVSEHVAKPNLMY